MGSINPYTNPHRKVFCFFFSKKKKNLLLQLTPTKKKKHNRESIPSALDIIRLIFRMVIKAVVRGCGVGAADSYCIIQQNFEFVNSSNCTIFE